ncbi:hypothetical protein C5E10_05275 [Pseudoclavibacter sp. RFBG4]|uniref:hypothetical protein n=1 Tax=Pseudoclavibacter sp. RFBG4 TaxID=2080575 RepID=UPI000CE8924D|nr:hypothetical protein [Pseudoclavibacter sp. RFBG4]PPG35015.1 hypothetical protein C5E10_05275 [Pseudoclavibacter sp. RFBG4]
MPSPKYLHETSITRSGQDVVSATAVAYQIRERLAGDGFRGDDLENSYGEPYQVTYRLNSEGVPKRVTLTQLRPLIRSSLLQHLYEVLRQAYSLELDAWQVKRVRDTCELLERNRPGATRYVERAVAEARDNFPDLSAEERQGLARSEAATHAQEAAKRPRMSTQDRNRKRRLEYQAMSPLSDQRAQQQAARFYALKLSKFQHFGRRERVELWRAFEDARDEHPEVVARELPELLHLKRTTFYGLLAPHLDDLRRRDVGWTYKPGAGALQALVSHGYTEAANRLQSALNADQPDRSNS